MLEPVTRFAQLTATSMQDSYDRHATLVFCAELLLLTATQRWCELCSLLSKRGAKPVNLHMHINTGKLNALAMLKEVEEGLHAAFVNIAKFSMLNVGSQCTLPAEV